MSKEVDLLISKLASPKLPSPATVLENQLIAAGWDEAEVRRQIDEHFTCRTVSECDLYSVFCYRGERTTVPMTGVRAVWMLFVNSIALGGAGIVILLLGLEALLLAAGALGIIGTVLFVITWIEVVTKYCSKKKPEHSERRDVAIAKINRRLERLQ